MKFKSNQYLRRICVKKLFNKKKKDKYNCCKLKRDSNKQLVLKEFFGTYDYFIKREYNGLEFVEKKDITQFKKGEKGIP